MKKQRHWVYRLFMLTVLLLVCTMTFVSCDGEDTPPAHEHTIVIDSAVEATCTKEGLTAGAHCYECGAILVKQETVSKLPHTIVIDEAVDSTCNKAGLTSGAHCSACGEILVAQSEVSPKTHTYDDKYDAFCNVCGYERDAKCAHTNQETIAGKPATCTAEGLSDGKKCVQCGEVLMAQEIVPPLDHTFVNNICKECGKKMDSQGLAYIFNNDGTCYVCGIGNCTDSDVVIPEYFNGYKVAGFSGDAFRNCWNLTSIDIPNSVQSIDWGAFEYCSSLTSIVIPDSVTSIGDYAFRGCSSLTSIVIPDSVTSIGDSAFSGCSSLTSVKLPDSVTSIGNYAFHGCSSLESIAVEQGNTVYHSVGNCLIETASKTLIAGCNNSVIPTDGSVTSIGDWAFYGCSSLTSIVIPDSVTSIGEGAFEYCSSLTSIVIPDSVTSIGDWAFGGCSSLVYNEYDNAYYLGNNYNPYLVLIRAINTSITSCKINSNTKLIYSDAFSDCGSLTSIEIPDSVTSIGDGAFCDCSSLTSIVIPDSVTSIGGIAFWHCSGLTSIELGKGVISIGNQAFEDCYNLTNVIIPKSVTSIDHSAFAGCNSLESIIVELGNPIYHSDGNCLIETATKTLIIGCKNSVIPADGSVTCIDWNAFNSCGGLRRIDIPDNVTSICSSAFWGCSSLESIVISDSVTSIDSLAFAYCRRLTSINFEGTIEQWNAIYKDTDWSPWDLDTGNYTIYCTDGTITKTGDVTYN